MARDVDGIIQTKFANSGDVGLGGLDLNIGWPLSYSTAGGDFPKRIQFNQLFRFAFALAKEINQGGPFLSYSNLIDYLIGADVTGSDGIIYTCLIVNGPSSTIINPVGDLTGTWTRFSVRIIGSSIPGDVVMLPYLPTPTQLINRRLLQADGAELADVDYPDILANWGSKLYGWTTPDHFHLPNYQGFFLRTWDDSRGIDPDAAARLDRGDGTTGDYVGTVQYDDLKSHQHSMDAGTSPGEPYINHVLHSLDTLGPAPTSYTGGNETRPKNMNVWVGIQA